MEKKLKLQLFDNCILKKQDIFRISCFFAFPLPLAFILINMALAYSGKFNAFYSQPVWIMKVLLTYLFLLAFQGVVFCICKRDFLSFVITASGGYILDFVHQTMCATTGDPLLPTDLLMVGQFKKIAGYVSVPLTVSEIIGLVLILILIFTYLAICKKIPRKPFKKRVINVVRIVFIVFFLIYSYLFCISYGFRYTVLKGCNVSISAFSAVEDYNNNGCILAFFPKLGEMFVHTPDDYNENKIDKIVAKYTQDIAPFSNKQPDIIAIQSEAWWDPVLLKNATFSVDPMALYRAYGKDSAHARTGFLVTPVFAGGTCLPEFEFLTGLNTLNLPSNTYPYIQSVKEDTASFVWEYRNNGYETVAIHPYSKDFYSRDTAYAFLGFEKFLGEEDMVNNSTKGVYISDESLAKEIIRVYETSNSKNTFIYGVSMQNHGGYNYFRYPSYDIEVTGSTLNNDDLIGLKDYTQGVYDAINSFKILTDYFENVTKPVVVVMYGDHLPLLGISGSTYIDGGMAEEGNESNYTEDTSFFHTPYIIWANYDISELSVPKYMSATTLGLEVYKMASFTDTPEYINMFNALFTRVPVYHHKGLIKNDGSFVQQNDSYINNLIEEYKLISHDLLHGDKYTEK
ncbi:MAG: LTA synthase family protein [Clostridia bacterium]|nr:LTA synthase family protein [Clostridia bacterium]